MKKYKVEITKTFCLDVEATTEEQAKNKAKISLIELEKIDRQHNTLTGDVIFNVYNVTNTDDPFNK